MHLQQIRHTRLKSRPLLDRIDIHIEVPSVRYRNLRGKYSGESSSLIRQRINGPDPVRWKGLATRKPMQCPHVGQQIRQYCPMDEESSGSGNGDRQTGLKCPGLYRILKVAGPLPIWKMKTISGQAMWPRRFSTET